jgi:quercetin dioxygenase-like cupin family protein
MSDQPEQAVGRASGSAGGARHPQESAGLVPTFDLRAAAAALLAEGARAGGGHRARTLVKDTDLRVVLVTLAAGARLAEHHAPGRITIHTLSGHLIVRAAGEAIELPAGHLLTLAGAVPHEVAAREASAFLLTIAWPSDRAEAPPVVEE